MATKKFSFFKKVLGFLLLMAFLVPILAQPISAYDSTPESEDESMFRYYPDVFEKAVEAPEMNLESFVNETVKSIFWGTSFYYLSRSPLGPFYDATICGWDATSATGMFGCLVGFVGDAFFSSATTESNLALENAPTPIKENILVRGSNAVKDIVQTVPLSSLELFKWWGQKLEVVRPAYAQGFGHATLNPLIEAWSVMRNAAYALSAIAFVIIGFMIMFRMKISPQAVVTAQMAIPRVVMTLLLITFSYAIAGLLIDLVWVVTILFGNLLGVSGNVMEAIKTGGIFKFFFDSGVWLPNLLAGFAIIGNWFRNHIFALAVGGAALGGAVVTGSGLVALGAMGIVAIIALLVMAIFILITAFKITIMLFKAFLYFCLYTIIGPLWIFLGILPGVKGVGSWFKALISQAVIFPATAILLMIANKFMPGPDNYIRFFEATFEESHQIMPLMGQTNGAVIQIILGLGITMFIPKLAKMIQQLTRSIDIGEGLGLGLDPLLQATGIKNAAQRRFGSFVTGGDDKDLLGRIRERRSGAVKTERGSAIADAAARTPAPTQIRTSGGAPGLKPLPRERAG